MCCFSLKELKGSGVVLTSCPEGPENRILQCWQRSVSWRTTCKIQQRHSLKTCVCVCMSAQVKVRGHSLPLVVGQCDALRWHFEVDHGGGRRWIHGERDCGGLLHGLVSRQWFQLHGAQVPHVTGCTAHVNIYKVALTHAVYGQYMCVNMNVCVCCTCSLFEEFSCWVCSCLCRRVIHLHQWVWKHTHRQAWVTVTEIKKPLFQKSPTTART